MGILRVPRTRQRLRPVNQGAFPPLAPSNATATQVNKTTVSLSWTDNADNETGFTIYESVGGGAYANLTTVAANATSAANVNTSVVIGTVYSYIISATNSAGAANSSAANITPTYQEGYPAFGYTEANVAAQWSFNQASGDLVDRVSSITLTSTGSTLAPTYNVAATGNWAGVTPGVTYENAATAQSRSSYHKVAATQATMDPGTGDFTIEFVASLQDLGNDADQEGITYIFSTDTNVANNPIFYSYLDLNQSAKNWNVVIHATDGTTISKTFVIPTDPCDGLPHKFRIAADRAGNMVAYFDGTSCGTQSLATLSGKTLGVTNQFTISGSPSGSEAFHGTIYEFRWSLNGTNNSGGPSGG